MVTQPAFSYPRPVSRVAKASNTGTLLEHRRDPGARALPTFGGREWCSLRGRSEKDKRWSLHRLWQIGGQLAVERRSSLLILRHSAEADSSYTSLGAKRSTPSRYLHQERVSSPTQRRGVLALLPCIDCWLVFQVQRNDRSREARNVGKTAVHRMRPTGSTAVL